MIPPSRGILRPFGAAYVFRRDGEFWQETRKLQPAIDEQFPERRLLGGRVALNARFVMVSMIGVGASEVVFLRLTP
jgi:hypothetical protein